MPGDGYHRCMADRDTEFRSFDGTRLSGTVATAERPQALAVLVHGAGVTREEGGFFTRLAGALAASWVDNLRFDLRAHGSSDGREQDITMAGVANDIRAAADHLRAETGSPVERPVHVIAASFSGGAAALVAANYPAAVDKLVLLNPRLDYRQRYITSRPYIDDADYLDEASARELEDRGFTERSPFGLGRALLNEVHYLDPAAILPRILSTTLLVHGTKDTFVPVESSRHYLSAFGGGAELIELDGAQHGFAVHDDPQYLDPQTQAWQTEVIEKVTAFLAAR